MLYHPEARAQDCCMQLRRVPAAEQINQKFEPKWLRMPFAVGWRAFLGWVAGWLSGWVAGWLGGWLAGWLAGWMDGWMGVWVGPNT